MPPQIELPGMFNAGYASAGSRDYEAARNACAWKTVLVRLRFNGVYLPWELLNERPRVVCKLLSFRDGRVEVLAQSEVVKPPVRGLSAARVLKRREDGSYLIEGNEWDEARLRTWPQTLLCSKSVAEVNSALLPMRDWLHKEYERVRAQFQVRR